MQDISLKIMDLEGSHDSENLKKELLNYFDNE